MNEVKPTETSIYSDINLDDTLMDFRHNRYGQKFGKVTDICRQYGIKYRKLEKCTEFTAPKIRLQMFLEKLHFSKSSYRRQPY